MGDLWIQVLTRDEPDLVTSDARVPDQGRGRGCHRLRDGDRAAARPTPALHDDAALLYLELGRPDRAVEHFQTDARAARRRGAGAL